MINFKQEELVEKFVQVIHEKFPEVEYLGVTESPENPNNLWVNFVAPDDEDREEALVELASNLTIDILVQYGYHLLIMTRRPDSDFTRRYKSRNGGKQGMYQLVYV